MTALAIYGKAHMFLEKSLQAWVLTIICVKNTEQSMFKKCCAKYKRLSNVLQLLPLDIARYQTNSTLSLPALPPALLERARSVSSEHAQLSKKLAHEFDPVLAKRLGELSVPTRALENWKTASNSFSELQQLLQDPSTDSELRSLAEDELQTSSKDLDQLSNHLRTSLVPPHPFAHLPCLLELRPGAGGGEAGLFAGDLLRMYQAFCRRHGLRCNIIKLDNTSAGGGSDNQIHEAVLEIEAAGSYDLLRCEAGVHRVQRVPATETKGRTHTSAVAVLVLPSFPSDGADDGASSFDDPSSDYYIDPSQVRTDVMRARGAGGQHVNTTDSAVRLTHIPTNTVVSMQDSRSQQKNREKAWRILRAKIAQSRREIREEEKAQIRVSVVGVARMGRADKVRTYNWGQQRVTDHRSGITVHHLDDILEGGASLDEVMNSARIWLREQDVKSLVADEEALSRKNASKIK